ncbi:ABC transporter substrate-binding protein [Cohnella caldifontis]|uniref:ABC transporter substrate-binding protein n=1 Tax=Cohnella caldifontis TaxID=3027471 RepID=UPI0023ECA88B|nr:sugar ABC transporter substrate-binding protein [Cohnella sp. YIM B05605]
MSRKRFKGWGFPALALLLVLAACGGGGGGKESEGSPAPADGGSSGSGGASSPVELGITWWGPDERHQATLAALKIYSQQNPGVTFKPEYMAWDAFWQKLPTLAASKTVPDVLQMDAAYIQDYVSRGVMEDLSDIDLSGVVPDNILENVKIGGKLYGIPLSHNAQGVAYNKAALEAAGIPLPKQGWTWEEYFRWARDAKAKLPEDQYPIGDAANAWDWFQWYQASMGKGPIMSDGGKTFNLDHDLFVKFHEELSALRKDKVLPPPDLSLSFLENDPQADPMASGKVMTRGGTVGSVAALESLLPGKVDVVNVPNGPSGGGWAQSTIFLGVSSNSKHKEEAKKFVKWFITDPEGGKTLGLTRGIPINEAIYKELEPNLAAKDKLSKRLAEVASEKAMPFYPAGPGFTEWVDFYKTTMEAVMFGQKSIEDVRRDQQAGAGHRRQKQVNGSAG